MIFEGFGTIRQDPTIIYALVGGVLQNTDGEIMFQAFENNFAVCTLKRHPGPQVMSMGVACQSTDQRAIGTNTARARREQDHSRLALVL